MPKAPTTGPPIGPPSEPAASAPLLWGTPLIYLKGVGPKRSEKLAELGLRTVGDLLSHYPLRHEDRRSLTAVGELEHRQRATLELCITGPGKVTGRFGRTVAEVPASDGSEELKLLWFNQPYRATQFSPGDGLVVSGSAHIQRSSTALIVSEYERIFGEPQRAGGLTPIYPSIAGIPQSVLRGLVTQALERVETMPEGVVPPTVRERRSLGDLGQTIRSIHAPATMLEADQARRRLAYEKLFLLQGALALRRRRVKQPDSHAAIPADKAAADLVAGLPFTLTGAQQRVIREVLTDLERPEPMHRLVHGEVGSGKTVVAAAALLAAARAGRQGAMMAPTELLAEQHHEALGEMLRPLGVEVLLLTGSMTESAKRNIRQRLAAGEPLVAVGTHALFQSSVAFDELGLVVVDEQHRFGVKQRAALCAKGTQPNVLVMSATPIPRTLALTVYGDFDISVLDELPPGRRPIFTELMTGRQRLGAYDFIIKLVAQGQQAYIVCPVIAENPNSYVKGAEKHFAILRERHMPTLKLGLVHGEMEAGARRRTMEQFREGKLKVLVATSVIEVGVDVPNATVMMVENAERFGLSQLHQLRGRVGRAHHQAYCLLVSSLSVPEVIERLQTLVRTGDGFEIAREDLRRRGPGELAGTRQHGLPDLRMADLLADTTALSEAREDAFALLENDPELKLPEHQSLRRALKRLPEDGWALRPYNPAGRSLVAIIMRVIAGSARSIPLKYPRAARIRPTTDAMRESLFSSLGDLVVGARFADLYAGAGSVGIEALSRGAELTVFIERNSACVEALRTNLANTALSDRAQIVRGDVAALWERTWQQWGPFDLIFADPPYGLAQLRAVVRRLVDGAEGVAEGGRVIVQHARNEELGTEAEPLTVRRYGESQLTVFAVPGRNGDAIPCRR